MLKRWLEKKELPCPRPQKTGENLKCEIYSNCWSVWSTKSYSAEGLNLIQGKDWKFSRIYDMDITWPWWEQLQRVVRWRPGGPSVYCGEVSRVSCVSRCGIDISLLRRLRRRRKVEGDKYLYRIVRLKGDYFCLFAFFFLLFKNRFEHASVLVGRTQKSRQGNNLWSEALSRWEQGSRTAFTEHKRKVVAFQLSFKP